MKAPSPSLHCFIVFWEQSRQLPRPAFQYNFQKSILRGLQLKRFLFATLFCALLLSSQFSCSNSKQPKTVTGKDVPSANMVAASPEVADLTRLISKLTYYRSPRNLQEAKTQSIEEIKATFGKQAPDVDPVIEGIYKELSDKYKNDPEFVQGLNHVFLKYLFMIEDEPRFTALINQMPEDHVFGSAVRYNDRMINLAGSLASSKFKKDRLLTMLKEIKNIDVSIQNSIGDHAKLLALYRKSNYSDVYIGPYEFLGGELGAGNFFAVQSEEFCPGSPFPVQFDSRQYKLDLLLADSNPNSLDEDKWKEIFKRVNIGNCINHIFSEVSNEDFQKIQEALSQNANLGLTSLKAESKLMHVPEFLKSSAFKINAELYIISLGYISGGEGSRSGFLVIKKKSGQFSPRFYIAETLPIC
jgi:hypothetical protein